MDEAVEVEVVDEAMTVEFVAVEVFETVVVETGGVELTIGGVTAGEFRATGGAGGAIGKAGVTGIDKGETGEVRAVDGGVTGEEGADEEGGLTTGVIIDSGPPG